MKKFIIFCFLLLPLNVKSSQSYYYFHLEALIMVMKNDNQNYPKEFNKKKLYDISKVNECEYSIRIKGREFIRKYYVNICKQQINLI